MNCEKCQELLSDHLDGSLPGGDRVALARHLELCLDCAEAHDELRAILGAASECREHLYAPPDARAMWLRISNTIEGERAFNRAAAAVSAPRAEGFWSGLFNRRWQLTLPQMAAAVSAVAVSVSLITVLGVQGLNGQDAPQQQVVTRPTGEDLPPNSFLRQQQARINYLQQRVEQRKAGWHPRMRDSFERSLIVIDQTVDDSLDELKTNPHDEVSEEMLNSALRDKVELLREFSEQ